RGVVVLAGGASGASDTRDLWEWDGAWSRVGDLGGLSDGIADEFLLAYSATLGAVVLPPKCAQLPCLRPAVRAVVGGTLVAVATLDGGRGLPNVVLTQPIALGDVDGALTF